MSTYETSTINPNEKFDVALEPNNDLVAHVQNVSRLVFMRRSFVIAETTISLFNSKSRSYVIICKLVALLCLECNTPGSN